MYVWKSWIAWLPRVTERDSTDELRTEPKEVEIDRGCSDATTKGTTRLPKLVLELGRRGRCVPSPAGSRAQRETDTKQLKTRHREPPTIRFEPASKPKASSQLSKPSRIPPFLPKLHPRCRLWRRGRQSCKGGENLLQHLSCPLDVSADSCWWCLHVNSQRAIA